MHRSFSLRNSVEGDFFQGNAACALSSVCIQRCRLKRDVFCEFPQNSIFATELLRNTLQWKTAGARPNGLNGTFGNPRDRNGRDAVGLPPFFLK